MIYAYMYSDYISGQQTLSFYEVQTGKSFGQTYLQTGNKTNLNRLLQCIQLPNFNRQSQFRGETIK
jgi:hypothetical protein